MILIYSARNQPKININAEEQDFPIKKTSKMIKSIKLRKNSTKTERLNV
jgi:hypothetical protein